VPAKNVLRFLRLISHPKRLERFERLERVHFRYFGGTGTTVPHFLQVLKFSSP
jgi:hypothetical protein